MTTAKAMFRFSEIWESKRKTEIIWNSNEASCKLHGVFCFLKLYERGQTMKPKRILSEQAKVYHRPGCRYIRAIKINNRAATRSLEEIIDAKILGYRPCKCCNTIGHLYKQSKPEIDKYRNKGMTIEVKKDEIIVQTTVGWWKLVYDYDTENVKLFHGDCGSNRHYHRQRDVKRTDSIVQLLTYIFEHDRFKEAQEKGEKLKTFTSGRARVIAERRYRGEQRRRIDSLFASIEQEHKNYRKLSCW